MSARRNVITVIFIGPAWEPAPTVGSKIIRDNSLTYFNSPSKLPLL